MPFTLPFNAVPTETMDLTVFRKNDGIENISRFCAILIVVPWIVTTAAEAPSSTTMPSIPLIMSQPVMVTNISGRNIIQRQIQV